MFSLEFHPADLAKASDRAKSIVKKNSPAVVATMARLAASADGKSVQVATTDFNQSITVDVPVIAASGSVCIPAMELATALSRLDGTKAAKITADGSSATVRQGRTRVTMPCLPGADFPEMQAQDIAASLNLPGHDFAEALRRVLWAASDDMKARAYLCGVYLDLSDADAPCLVATDGRGLAREPLPPFSGGEGAPSVIIPRDSVAEIIGIADASDCVILGVGTNSVSAKGDGIAYQSRLLEGVFPQYRQVLPSAKDTKTQGSVTADDIKQMASIAGLAYAAGALKTVGVDMSVSDGSLTYSAGSQGYEVEGAIKVQGGDGITTRLDVSLLAKAAASCGTDELIIAHGGDPKKPLVLMPVGGHVLSLRLVMPLRA